MKKESKVTESDNKRLFMFGAIVAVVAIAVPHCVHMAMADVLPGASPTPSGVPVTVVAPATMSTGDFLSAIFAYVKSMGGMSFLVKMTGIITLIIASMKVSIINTYVWSKLGNFKALVAPFLGIVAGIIGVITTNGGHFQWAIIVAYLGTGTGAIAVHEMLDSIKAIPGLGAIYVQIINFVSNLLGGPQDTSTTTNSQ